MFLFTAPEQDSFYMDQHSPKKNAGIMCVYHDVQQQVIVESDGVLAKLELSFYVYVPGSVIVRIRKGLGPSGNRPIVFQEKVLLIGNNTWVPRDFNLLPSNIVASENDPFLIEIEGTNGNIQMVRGNFQPNYYLPPYYKHELYASNFPPSYKYGFNWRMGFKLWMKKQ
jgi:hypothetical protein